ncbi:uncharacterized protein V1518DRAFT_421260 [Limtongia smithiae]|uniref:uncharacterized protein n=1 Tax=Limtongia smithiae TaxID=1125753 RepID=UPI0034CD7C5C
MNTYLSARALDSPRRSRIRPRHLTPHGVAHLLHASRPPRIPLRTASLESLDPLRRLSGHVLLGCAATAPFYVVTLHIPEYSSAGSSHIAEFDGAASSEGHYSDDVGNFHNAEGALYFWKLKRADGTLTYRCIDYSFKPIVLFPATENEVCRVPIARALSQWSLSDEKIVQVVFRCEGQRLNNGYLSACGTGDGAERSRFDAREEIDREIIEFRVASPERARDSQERDRTPVEAHIAVVAGAGEFDHRSATSVNLELYEDFAVVAVCLNSRMFIFRQHKSGSSQQQIGRNDDVWHPVVASDITYQVTSSAAAVDASVIELDYFLMSKRLQRTMHRTDVDGTRHETICDLRPDEFAIRCLKTRQGKNEDGSASAGYVLAVGALDTRHNVIATCVVQIDVLQESVRMEARYMSDTSVIRNGKAECAYNAHAILDRIIGTSRVFWEYRLHCRIAREVVNNMKRLESFERGRTSVDQIKMPEVGISVVN